MAEITQIVIAGVRIGITGFDDALNAVDEEALEDDEVISKRLLEIIAEHNFIPEASRDEYGRALLIEYKRRKGEQIESDSAGQMEIEVLGPGCANCDRLMKEVRSVLAEIDLTANLIHIKDLGAIAAYGPVATPGLVINGKVVSQGRVPHRSKLIQILKEETQ